MYTTYDMAHAMTAEAFTLRAIEVKENLKEAFDSLGKAEAALGTADSKVFSDQLKYIDSERKKLWDMILLLADMGVNEVRATE